MVSKITSYCTITKIDIIKNNGEATMGLSDFVKNAGNKTVFTADELTITYNDHKNVVMIELVYNGFFGKGHNVIHKNLKNKDCSIPIPIIWIIAKNNLSKY